MYRIPYVYGRLVSRDLFDLISQYMYEVVTAYRMYGYVSGVFGGNYRTVPMESVGAIYYWPDRLWIFSGNLNITEEWKLYNFFFLAVDREYAPLYGATIIMREPVELEPGRYEFRVEYVHTVDEFFTVDAPCINPQNYNYAEYLCPI